MLSFLLNSPFTLVGILSALVCLPKSITIHKKPFAIVFKVKNNWWGDVYSKGMRACTIGYVIILTPKTLKNDFEHELIHIRQYEKYPFIFPAIYCYEFFKNGYRKNKFEDEAYAKSGSIYKEK